MIHGKNFKQVLRLVILVICAAKVNAQTDSDSLTQKSIIDYQKYRPQQLLIGLQGGVMGSRLSASPAYNALIRPTTPNGDPWLASSFGVMITTRWKTGISLSLAPRKEYYGVKTQEQTVSFPDNPFPHTLKATTELSYNIWPLLLGMGWFTSRQHFQAQIGTYVGFLDQAHVKWTVDGEPYANTPTVQFRDTPTGWLLGTEYGLRWGKGEMLIGVDTQHGTRSLASGLAGSIRAESARVHLAYLWTLMQK
jgi:hypothetical protein